MRNLPFTHHTISAIKINNQRKKHYSSLTNGKSRFISNTLKFCSVLMIPFTLIIDLYSKKFNKFELKILENDFIQLSEINIENKPIERQNIISEADYIKVNKLRKEYLKTIKQQLKQKKLIELCENSAKFIRQIEMIEKEGNCNIPMTKHIAESIGFNALHGIEYSNRSFKKTLNFTIFIEKFQLLGLYNSLRLIDKRCQLFFQSGVGIVLNDIPSIPFLKEWEDYLSENK
ncbi:MAG: hypothetical protein JXL97_09395 [Bacteroidales bacterium]|nr:hypothetical protein [Bacteroidales bacterium]